MEVLFFVVDTLLRLYGWVLIATVISSWLIAFGIVNAHNNVVRSILETCHALTEPVLRPIRNIMPSMGGLDISPVIVLIGISALRMALRLYVFGPLIDGRA